ncbi:hypothetical protein BDF19DRAFT_471629 [Syncephalis fuscata]|nr:hypothetical protein BDF19DRAFT_471629 [Syncephalis fuscata]
MRPTPRLDLLYGSTLLQRVASARVLMVGAGGIGCELLKNLVMSGFRRIEVVDLDTIDLSNLNRQFLFQKRHIKLSKANVARESALQFNPAVDIQAHHANIKDQRFDVNWFRGFDLVTNALDNLDARRHVNRMCLAANVPLIESGTAGYLGQATVIQPNKTECFDCQPKPTPTTFPICTIRSTPTAPIHCIVWAKSYLFAQLFDRPDDNDDNTAITTDTTAENAAEISFLNSEAEALGRIRDAAGHPGYAKQIFQKVFHDDIVRLASMEEMWQSRSPPVPLQYETFEGRLLDDTVKGTEQQEMATNEQRTWSINECFQVFVNSTTRLGERLVKLKENDIDAAISFDKDDNDTLDFVTATSNIRASLFNIEPKSRFDVKSMAGSIIPAIASTNAIIAGVIVMQAMRVLHHQVDECKTIYLGYGGRRDRLFYPEQLSAPNPACYVCRNVYITLPVDIERATLGDVVDRIIIPSVDAGGLGLGDEVTLMEASRMLYDVDWCDNKTKTLASLGLTNGKLLTVMPDDVNVMGEAER